jgi:pyruvate/2-oxoglutarate/acetoin dehydrogenase E1 component
LPFDKELVLESVKSTGKVLVLHEASLTGGVGGEIAAWISEHAFQYLDAPVKRLAASDTPVPFAPTLEEAVLPTTGKIVEALTELIRY